MKLDNIIIIAIIAFAGILWSWRDIIAAELLTEQGSGSARTTILIAGAIAIISAIIYFVFV